MTDTRHIGPFYRLAGSNWVKYPASNVPAYLRKKRAENRAARGEGRTKGQQRPGVDWEMGWEEREKQWTEMNRMSLMQNMLK